MAEQLDKLPESIDGTAKELAVVFDFDKDSCYPSAAVSRAGKQNGGLRATGEVTGECREIAQLTNSNTYYRKECISKESVTYCVHMYALYFMKDQSRHIPGVEQGHRHDWEFALLWTRNGALTHASYSAHGDVFTKPTAELHFDPRVVVYEHNNYAGRSQVLDVGRYDVGQLSIGNDQISSVKVTPRWKVTLYAEARFGGDTKVLTADTPALPDFNDRTSSIVVERSAFPGVVVYEHNNYAGRSQVLDVGRYDVGQLSIGNDQISSVKVTPGWKVTLYAEARFWGDTKVLTADTPALPDFNDRTSSIVVEGSALNNPTVKIVYHKDGLSTHAFRFAMKGEMAENHLNGWITPTLVDWDTMRSDTITNQELKQKFNQFDWGSANCPFNDKNFGKEIAKNPPGGYPF